MNEYTVWILSTDNGDGSAGCNFFASEEQALAYISAREADMEEPVNPENLYAVRLAFDNNGTLLNPDKWEF